ncbi:MAG TPA: hypothetical protein VK737_06585 [Opitutales bacterium]|jgi:hypothetical protein|nr:hypothetical protein [Opitutales bacterium]
MAKKRNHAATSTPPAKTGSGIGVWLLVAIIISGVVCRGVEYFANRSLWLDEAALAQNVLQASVRDLAAGRLGGDQVAPPGFLLATRGVTVLAGSSEQALRFIPLVAGLALLVIFGWAAWRKLGRAGALAATALLAWSWPMIYYANEFKQYSTDALIAFLLFIFREKFLTTPLSDKRMLALAAVGMAALVFSQPAIFVLGALGIMGWVGAIKEKQWKNFAGWTVIGLVWVAFFALQIWLSFDTALGNPALRAYHNELFLRLWPLDALIEVLRAGVLGTWVVATAEHTWWFWLALVVIGTGMAWRKQRPEFIFITLILFFTALASLLQFYPLTARLLLFALPLLFWLAGRGVDALADYAQPRKWGLALAALLLIAFWPLMRDRVEEARAPLANEHLRPVVARLATLAKPGDVVLVFDLTRYAFDYYWPRVTHAEVSEQIIKFGSDTPTPPEKMAVNIAPLLAAKPPRLWLVATHDDLGAAPDNLKNLITILRAEYPEVANFAEPNSTALGVVFYQKGQEPTLPTAVTAQKTN